jgi:DNA-binding MarR family transcriptional regulator
MARRTGTGGSLGADFRLDDYIFYLMAHVDHRYSAGMARTLARNHISRPMWRCLAALNECDGISIKELGQMSLIKQSTLSRLLERMERNGLIRRRPRRGDERVTEIHVTAAGRDLLVRVFTIASQVYDRAVSGISAQELQQVRRVLKRMLDNLDGNP